MSRLVIAIGAEATGCRLDDRTFVVPAGARSLVRGGRAGDAPRPEELTNAIGLVMDHLDDLVRALPEVVGLPVVLTGAEAEAIAAVEVGAIPTLPMSLAREVVEEVFRTVATEPSTDRAKNPGLAAELVETVVGGCCIAVAVMRRLHLDELTVEATAPDASDAG